MTHNCWHLTLDSCYPVREGGVLWIFWVGVCHWESDTLLYPAMFSCIFRSYSRLDPKNSFPILDSLLQVSRNFISVAVSCFYGKRCPILGQNSLISIPYPRLNCSKMLSFTVAPYSSQQHIPIYLIYESQCLPPSPTLGLEATRSTVRSHCFEALSSQKL